MELPWVERVSIINNWGWAIIRDSRVNIHNKRARIWFKMLAVAVEFKYCWQIFKNLHAIENLMKPTMKFELSWTN